MPGPSVRQDSPSEFRLIHYLGSKLRFLRPIVSAVGEVAPPGSLVCDLFAGSGAVSAALSGSWTVTAVDIQEYSRVLCDAVLNPVADPSDVAVSLVSRAKEGRLRTALRAATVGLAAYEQECLARASAGDADSLVELLDFGALAAGSDSAVSARLGGVVEASLKELRAAGLSAGPDTVATRHFGGAYFSWEQAADLDALLAEIHRIDDLRARDYFLAALLAVASDAVNTVGKHFAQPIRARDSHGNPKLHLVRQTVRDRTIDVFDTYGSWLDRMSRLPRSGAAHVAQRRDYRDALADPSSKMDAVYADPPYTRDHYSRFYHVLETMALHDEPEVSRTMIRAANGPRASRGVYRLERHQSPFCIKSQAPGAFDDLFRGVRARAIPLVLSYSPYNAAAGNRPRLLTVRQLVDIASRHFSSVVVRDVGGVAHNKFNLSERNIDVDYVAEVLITCRP